MKKINIDDILLCIKPVGYTGKKNIEITHLIDFQNNVPQSHEQLFWSNDKNAYKLNDLSGGTVILSEASFASVKNERLNFIVVQKPRLAFKQVLEAFFLSETKKAFISPSARISPSAKCSASAYIGENVVIDDHCEIGEGVSIGHNTVIHAHTIIKNNVSIGCNNTIGSVGFGYEKNEEGLWEMIPHIGNVIIHEHTEIGNNNCIDKAVLGSTVIGRNVKIDNLVHIAHGVKIGENSLIIAHAMIGGSAVIGKNVWVGPNASVINHGSIHDDGFIGMGAVVIKPVEKNSVVAGNPAKHLRNNL